ncbi:unnamed protein product [Urochloa decumbens]|uniref:F-box/LRR-repeat protein 15/At3g58940/PEG3-like LRR domain-containing protein n=1 Tax=Urochloa decumbens TaxID=240449 RepID=A0ABC9B040_9POAL
MDDDGEDRISGLPDELLHAILARLGSPGSAVRTGVLSRRWRHLWAPQPELVLGFVLDTPRPPLPAFLEAVDAALAACAAPTLGRLCILPPGGGGGVPAGRLEPWLRFASERVVGSILLLVRPPPETCGEEEAVLDLPACEGVTTFDLSFEGDWRLRPASAGIFRALTVLRILSCRIEASELAALVSTHCPCLTDLMLTSIVLVSDSDLPIRSDSLRSLWFAVRKTRRLEIVALRLEKLCVSAPIHEARISAPNLAELEWSHPVYNPNCHHFDDVGCRLRKLELGLNASLMQQFDEVDELKLAMFIPEGIAAYQNFLDETNNLPKCKILTVSSGWDYHGLVPGMLHLLRSCSSMRKVFLLDYSDYAMRQPCVPACPCLLEESNRIDDISLGSLEEVEITSYTSYHGALEFVEQLSRCNVPILEKVVLKQKTDSAPPPTKELCEKIRSMWHPNNIEVEYCVFSDRGECVCID